MADGRRFVIRFDNRDGCNTTSCPPGEPNQTLPDMARDAVAILDGYGVDRAQIVGRSMGGMITQLVGLRRTRPDSDTDHVDARPWGERGCVGGKTNPVCRVASTEVIAALMDAATLGWTNRAAVLEYRLASFRTLAGSAYPYDEASRKEVFAAEIERAVSFASTQNHFIAVNNSMRWHERLRTLDIPTLAIHGTEDPLIPYDHGHALADSIAGSTMLPLERVGHEIPEQSHDVVVPAILNHTRWLLAAIR